MDLIDIGINLAHDSFDKDRDAVVARARDAGVVQMVITGSSLAASSAAADLAATQPGYLFATAGIHPHHASEFDASTAPKLKTLMKRPEVVAAGECGLDYFRNFSTPEEQEKAFEAQLQIAAETGKPVFLHQRGAQDRFVAILKQHRDTLSAGVAHCFTGTARELRECLDLDLYIGITGWICDDRRGTHLKEVVPAIPRDRLMIETDAPYLMPRDLDPKPKSRRNEPMYLAHIATTVAAALGIGTKELAEITSANARRFFDLPEP